MMYQVKSKKKSMPINFDKRKNKAELFKLYRTVYNNPCGSRYSEKTMNKMGFERKKLNNGVSSC